MNESIFTKYKNKREKDIIFKPRTGEEMSDAMHNQHTPIHKYSDLCRLANKFGANGANRVLAHMFKKAETNIILLQDPHDMMSGHWLSVSRNLPKKEIYFFSTYGGKPDVEKIQWLNEDDLRESGQFLNLFNDGLRDLQKHGWEIHYNDYPYQKPGDKTAVCGIYTVAFLQSKLNPDEFERETLNLVKKGINPAIFYYDKYFA